MCLLGRQWFFDKYHVFLRQLNLVKLDSFVAGGWLQAKCWCQVKALLKAKWVYSDSIFLDQRKTLEDLIIHIGFSGFFPCHPPLWTPVRILPQTKALNVNWVFKSIPHSAGLSLVWGVFFSDLKLRFLHLSFTSVDTVRNPPQTRALHVGWVS